MDKSSIVKTVREKGPIFVVGAIAGVLVVTAIFHREKIKENLNIAWKRLSQRGIRSEHS